MYISESGSQAVFSMQDWFFNYNRDTYTLTCDPSQPIVFEKGGAHYINMFKGIKAKNDKKYDDYTQEQKSACEFIWEHIHKVICSDNELDFKYLRQHIANTVLGRKQKTIVLLLGEQGSGKSTVFEDFIGKLVIGQEAFLITNDRNCLLGRFNGELQGKCVLFFSEPQGENTGIGYWEAFSDKMKHLATGFTIELEFKGKDKISIPNIITVYLVANRMPMKIEKGDRRVFAPLISGARIGDTTYFDKLVNCIEIEGVAECFYSHCAQIADPNFNSLKELLSLPNEVKKTVIAQNLHPVYKYVKEAYLEQKDGLDMVFADFVKEVSWSMKGKPLSRISVTKLLKKIDIETVRKNVTLDNGKKTTRFHLSETYEELLEKFQKHNLIHETDDIDDGTMDDDVIDDIPKKKVDKTDYKLELLMEKLDDLKRENEDLRAQLADKNEVKAVTKAVVKKSKKKYKNTITDSIDEIFG